MSTTDRATAVPLNAHRLQLLVELESLGTVRAVAEALRLSPSAVSSALAALETETGTRLLDRVGRRVELTDAGRLLVGHARTILDRMTTAVAELRSTNEQPAGRVRLAAFTSALRTIGLPLAAELRSSRPGIELELLELDPQDSIPALRRGRCDIAISSDFVGSAARNAPEIVVRPLLADQIVFVTADQPDTKGGRRAAASSDPVDLADWSDRPWSMDMPGSYLATLITTLCARAGFEPMVAGRFTSYELQLEHVQAGLSVTLLPALAVDGQYRVRTLPLRTPVHRNVQVATRATATSAARDEVVRRLLHPGSVGDATYPR